MAATHLCKSPSLASRKFTVYLTDLAIKILISKVSWGWEGGEGVKQLEHPPAYPAAPRWGSRGHSPPRAAGNTHPRRLLGARRGRRRGRTVGTLGGRHAHTGVRGGGAGNSPRPPPRPFLPSWGRGSPEVGLGELLHVELLIRERGQVDVADRGEHVAWGGSRGWGWGVSWGAAGAPTPPPCACRAQQTSKDPTRDTGNPPFPFPGLTALHPARGTSPLRCLGPPTPAGDPPQFTLPALQGPSRPVKSTHPHPPPQDTGNLPPLPGSLPCPSLGSWGRTAPHAGGGE